MPKKPINSPGLQPLRDAFPASQNRSSADLSTTQLGFQASVSPLCVRIESRRSSQLLNIRISSRAFSSGFDISTQNGTLTAKKTQPSPTGEILIYNQTDDQIARVEFESILGRVYNIVISGGGFYRFGRDRKLKRTWSCEGEGRSLSLSERSGRRFLVSNGTRDIAECTQTWFTSGYEIALFDEADLRVLICIFLALHVSKDVGTLPM